MPSAIKKEIDGLHHKTIRWLWDELYSKIYEIGETRTMDELIIKFPLDRTYDINGYWKKYSYDVIDFGVYKLYLNSITYIPYKSMSISVDFYSDGIIGYLEISRKT